MTLKKLREEAGLSQAELGEALEAKVPSPNGPPRYFQPRISAYENGRNRMPLEVAMALVKLLNTALKKAGSKQRATLEALAAPKKKAPRG